MEINYKLSVIPSCDAAAAAQMKYKNFINILCSPTSRGHLKPCLFTVGGFVCTLKKSEEDYARQTRGHSETKHRLYTSLEGKLCP